MADLIKRIKPRSTAWRTTWVVMLVVLFSMVMSLLFFWRSLYLPELKQHAYYLANEIRLLQDAQASLGGEAQTNHLPISQPENQQQPSYTQTNLTWLKSHLSFTVVDDPQQFPEVSDKYFVELFTDEMERSLSEHLGEQVTIYFKFKPTPNLWVNVPSMQGAWLKQPVSFYANYSPSLIIGWLLGVPILSLIAILTLIRQINRPLERLRQAGAEYLATGHTENLRTHTGPIEIRQANKAFNQLFNTLEQNEKERTVMLAGISHDLRTPLTRMRLTAEMLPDEFFKEGLIYDIDDMDAILEQFISFMRDGSDEPIIPTDIDAIFQEVIVQFAPLSFTYQPNHLPKIPLRALSIKRMIVNLVSNAKRYGADPVSLAAYISEEVQALDETDDKAVAKTIKQLNIVVRDAGRGIAESELESIMQPFVRGEEARTTQGSGLGLAIVGRIARLHGGTVVARNHPQGGLEVRVRIPLGD